jgi:Asp-tRNA(Asn)/Glu-tRNA(Gln) amidotransferase A subunit family amidase
MAMSPIKNTLSLLALMLLTASCQHLPQEKTQIELSELTIEGIHAGYKNGTFDAKQLVQAYTRRIREYDEKINAITLLNPEALSVAESLDREFRETGKLRPLHGIPLIVKDNINTAGLPTTAGSLALEHYIPDEDAFIIEKLVEAGAIVLAKSNMAEWAFSPMHSESSTAGTTRNPYNLEYVPAGSSGGTGAAIAANFATAGLGTDTGNSIRGPSSHGALVGLRTTLGLVSRSGIVPLYLRNDVVGPMCRTVTDAVRLLEVMQGSDPEDPITRHSEGKTPGNYTQFLLKEGLRGARIGVLRILSEEDPDPEVHSLFETALADLEALGATVVDPVEIPDFAALSKNQWCATFREDLEAFLAIYVESDSLRTLEDLIRVGSKSDFARERLRRNSENSGRWEDREIPCGDPYTDPLRVAFREGIENAMDSLGLDALVYPTWNNKPAKIDQYAEQYRGDNSQLISPHTGQPAFTVPMGFTSGNLPAGLQFLGRMFDEPTLIRLAYGYEQGTGHRRPPKLD